MASSVATPLETPVLDHRRHRLDDLDQQPRLDPRSRCSSTSTATSTRAALDVQSAIAHRGARSLPPDMTDPPTYPKVNPADQPMLFLAPDLARPCRCSTLDELRRDHDRPAARRPSTASPRCRSSARRNTPCGSSSTPTPLGRDAASASTRYRPRSPPPTPIRPVGVAQRRPTAAYPARRTGQLGEAPTVPRPDRRLPQRHPGAPRRYRRRGSTASRTTRRASWFNGTRAIVLAVQRQPRRQHRRGGRRASRALLPDPGAAPAGGPRSDALMDRSISIRESVARRAVHPCAHHRAGRAGDLPVPAQPDAPRSSRPPALPMSHHRHLRRACTWSAISINNISLLALTLVGRLRGRRRHRHAGEHRPPHRGRARRRSMAALQGRARDRLHHRLHHHLAGRRVHSGAVHGRRGRPPVPRIRRHHQRRPS